MITKKSPAMVIILTLITCGIYAWIWFYQTSSELKNALNNDNNPGMDLLLIIVTCGIYGIYLYYRNAKQAYELKLKYGIAGSDQSVISIILAIFGFGIVSMGIIQNELNSVADLNITN